MYHEGQLHQRSWICGNHCNRKFSTPQLLKEHMLHCHLGTFAESQLPILIDMCERPADPDDKASCPLCHMEETLRALQTHVASHLEDLALFVLPLETDDHETDANSHHAERPREKDNRLDEDEISALGSFDEDEDVQAPLQDPKVFETALERKGEYSLAEVGNWLNTGQEVDSEEDERKDTVQVDLHTVVEARRRRNIERLLEVEKNLRRAVRGNANVGGLEPEVDEAIDLLQDVVKIKERLGEDHAEILTSRYELAEAYRANGHYDEAIGLLQNIAMHQERLSNRTT